MRRLILVSVSFYLLLNAWPTAGEEDSGNINTINSQQPEISTFAPELSKDTDTSHSEQAKTANDGANTVNATPQDNYEDTFIDRSSNFHLFHGAYHSHHLHHHHHQGPSYHGFWKKKFTWRPRWVKTWQEKKVYVAVWKRMWGPAYLNEWVPVPKPPPGWIRPNLAGLAIKTHPY